jgi:hypothetical protein
MWVEGPWGYRLLVIGWMLAVIGYWDVVGGSREQAADREEPVTVNFLPRTHFVPVDYAIDRSKRIESINTPRGRQAARGRELGKRHGAREAAKRTTTRTVERRGPSSPSTFGVSRRGGFDMPRFLWDMLSPAKPGTFSPASAARRSQGCVAPFVVRGPPLLPQPQPTPHSSSTR